MFALFQSWTIYFLLSLVVLIELLYAKSFVSSARSLFISFAFRYLLGLIGCIRTSIMLYELFWDFEGVPSDRDDWQSYLDLPMPCYLPGGNVTNAILDLRNSGLVPNVHRGEG